MLKRNSIGVLAVAGVAALTTLHTQTQAAPHAKAAPHARQTSAVEKSLLDVRLLQSYRVVLAKYGQPSRIFRYGELIPILEAYDANGKETGGVKGLQDDGTPGGGSNSQNGTPGGGGYPGVGRPGGGGGYPGAGRPGGFPGGGGGYPGAGRPGGFPGASGYPGGPGGYPGAGRPGGAMGGGRRGKGSDGEDGGGSGAPSAPGIPGASGGLSGSGGQTDTSTFADAGGYIWAYHYPKQELLYGFIFNADGRVIAVVQEGRIGGKPTSRSIGLGASIRKVYEVYGWPDSIEQQGPKVVLNYIQSRHFTVALLDNKVCGMAVVLNERSHITFDSSGSQGGGAPGAPAAGGGGKLGGRGAGRAGGGGGNSAD